MYGVSLRARDAVGGRVLGEEVLEEERAEAELQCGRLESPYPKRDGEERPGGRHPLVESRVALGEVIGEKAATCGRYAAGDAVDCRLD